MGRLNAPTRAHARLKRTWYTQVFMFHGVPLRHKVCRRHTGQCCVRVRIHELHIHAHTPGTHQLKLPVQVITRCRRPAQVQCVQTLETRLHLGAGVRRLRMVLKGRLRKRAQTRQFVWAEATHANRRTHTTRWWLFTAYTMHRRSKKRTTAPLEIAYECNVRSSSAEEHRGSAPVTHGVEYLYGSAQETAVPPGPLRRRRHVCACEHQSPVERHASICRCLSEASTKSIIGRNFWQYSHSQMQRFV
jgi:hypothetical protein